MRLDTFGDDGEVQRLGEADDRAHDRLALGVPAETVDERAVDLQRVDREPLEVGERRVAGAEVVDDEVHAELADRVEGPRRAGASSISVLSVISSHSASGSSPDRLSAAAMLATTSGSPSWRPDRFTLMWRSAAAGHGRLPVRGLGARTVQHPDAERQDEVGLLGDRDELVRGDRARSGGASGRAPRARGCLGPECTIGW